MYNRYQNSEINYVRLEEQLNQLLSDETIRRRRTALVDFVLDRLRERMQKRLTELGFSKKLEQEFLEQKTDSFYELIDTHWDSLNFSQRKLRRFKSQTKEMPASGLQYLWELQLYEETLRFREEAGISPKLWQAFIHTTFLPGDKTLEKLRSALSLTSEQEAEFDRRVIRRIFIVEEGLRNKAKAYRKQTGRALDDFLSYACLSQDTWESFYSADPDVRKKTSQETLLKLVIGFALEQTAAWDFMDTAHSTFVERRDLVVLSCICLEYLTPRQVYQILDFFAVDNTGDLLYTNFYEGFF